MICLNDDVLKPWNSDILRHTKNKNNTEKQKKEQQQKKDNKIRTNKQHNTHKNIIIQLLIKQHKNKQYT